MVSTVAQTPVAAYQQLIQNQENAYERTIAGVTLNSDLQHLADIINDTSGTYSQADKVTAYTKEYDSFGGSDLATHSSPANADQRVQHVKFDTVIADSEIGQAVIDGKKKYVALQQSQTWYDPNWESKFYASLSDFQKQLPDFVLYGPDAAFRSQIKDEITLSSSAQSLFRGTATTAQEATAEQEATQITAQLPQAYKAALDSTTLSPELQRLVTIINNVGGQYSAQDQVNAYTEATNRLENLPKTPQQIGEDPFGIIGGVSFAANLHYEKFSQMIQGSAVVAAEDAAASSAIQGPQHAVLEAASGGSCEDYGDPQRGAEPLHPTAERRRIGGRNPLQCSTAEHGHCSVEFGFDDARVVDYRLTTVLQIGVPRTHT